MTGSERLPLLFLDIDGPLIPFGADPGTYPTFTTGLDAVNPLLSRLDPGHGARLAALPCEVVWATTWQDDANACVAPLLGLPRLPVVRCPEPSDADGQDVRRGLHAKTRRLVAWAAGRPFVWIDDEITDRDRAWVAAHHPGRALLLRVDARVGLTDADYAACDAWLRRERDRAA
ncbi:HAD domain-containing protein [Streptomyces sp. NPDC058955]|uniref:HAD domain-containing protein n=1 Tax=unclassified Streptomyces TaxID=2593676 RepID=UPI003662BCCC